jgi:hypothetical protein
MNAGAWPIFWMLVQWIVLTFVARLVGAMFLANAEERASG